MNNNKHQIIFFTFNSQKNIVLKKSSQYLQIMTSKNECEGQNQVSGIHIQFELEGTKIKDLEEISRRAIQSSDVYNNHRISYWKVIGKNVCAVVMFQKRWRKNRMPRFQFTYKDRDIHPQIKVYKFQDFMEQRKAISKNSDFVYIEKRFSLTNSQISKQQHKFQQKFKQKGYNMQNILEKEEVQQDEVNLEEQLINNKKVKLSNFSQSNENNHSRKKDIKKNSEDSVNIDIQKIQPNEERQVKIQKIKQENYQVDQKQLESSYNEEKRTNSKRDPKNKSNEMNKQNGNIQENDIEEDAEYDVSDNEDSCKYTLFSEIDQKNKIKTYDTEENNPIQTQIEQKNKSFADASTQYSENDYYPNNKNYRKKKIIKSDYSIIDEDYQQGDEDGSHYYSNSQKEKKGNDFVLGYDEINRKKFQLTSKTLNQLQEVISGNNIKNREITSTLRTQLQMCLNGLELPLDTCDRYIELLQEKYSTNVKVRLLGANLLKSIIQNEDQIILKQLKLFKPITQRYFLFPFFNEYHASLLIYDSMRKKGFHVDSFLVGNSHVQILKGYKLNKFFRDFCRLLSHKKSQPVWQQSGIWKNLEIIKCPSQLNNNDSNICCLRNIHEFLLHDEILKINLQESYHINEIKQYREYIGACLLYDEYLSPY